MSIYQAPLRDYRFILEEVLGIYQQPQLRGFDQFDEELVGAILQGMAEFSTDITLPLNSTGDAEGCRLIEQQVVTPDGFKDAYQAYVDNGWPTLTCDPDYGGQGLPEVVGTFVTEMQAATNMAFAMYPGLTHGAYSAIHAHGDDALKSKYLPKLISGEWTGTMNLTESHAGTDLALLRAKAVPNADGTYAISGEKIFISSGDHDLAENIIHLVLARLPDAPDGVKGISLFAVPKFLVDAQGSVGERNTVTATSLEYKMGIKANSTCVMVFDGAQGELVGAPHQGLRAMFTMMNQARLGVGLQGLAQSDIAYQNALAYAKDRIQGRALSGVKAPDQAADPIIVHGDVRRMLLSQKSFNEGARALISQQALWIDESERHQDKAKAMQAAKMAALFTPVVKGFVTDQGFKACVDAQQVLGGHGYVHEWGMEQFVRDSRIAMIYEGTNGVQALDLLGRKILGDRAETLAVWFSETKKFFKQQNDPQMQPYIVAIKRCLKHLERATQFLVTKSASNPDVLGGASMAYMQLFGITALAVMWGKMASQALQQLDNDTEEADFYNAKIQTADIFISHWSVKTRGLVAQIEASSELIDNFDDHYF